MRNKEQVECTRVLPRCSISQRNKRFNYQWARQISTSCIHPNHLLRDRATSKHSGLSSKQRWIPFERIFVQLANLKYFLSLSGLFNSEDGEQKDECLQNSWEKCCYQASTKSKILSLFFTATRGLFILLACYLSLLTCRRISRSSQNHYQPSSLTDRPTYMNRFQPTRPKGGHMGDLSIDRSDDRFSLFAAVLSLLLFYHSFLPSYIQNSLKRLLLLPLVQINQPSPVQPSPVQSNPVQSSPVQSNPVSQPSSARLVIGSIRLV